MKCPICGERGIPFYKKLALILSGNARCKSCNTRFKGTNTYILLILGIELVIRPIDMILEYIDLTFIVTGIIIITILVLPIGKGMEVNTEEVTNVKIKRTKREKWIEGILLTTLALMVLFLFFPRSMVKTSKIPDTIEAEVSLRMIHRENISEGGLETKSKDLTSIKTLVNELQSFMVIRNPFNCIHEGSEAFLIDLAFNNGYEETLYIVPNNCVFIDNVHYKVINKDIDYEFLREFFKSVS